MKQGQVEPSRKLPRKQGKRSFQGGGTGYPCHPCHAQLVPISPCPARVIVHGFGMIYPCRMAQPCQPGPDAALLTEHDCATQALPMPIKRVFFSICGVFWRSGF
uniref:Uncharacterized protein n=1 Tax=Opuntia streptacantha TaxID=393608 RepID=A0A7C9CVB6_OPUST